jgi:diguanylate cyclase (GGDEF)-like protein
VTVLTGLLNRKTFESQFDKLRQRLSDAAQPFALEPSWLALLDIDHFKAINDRHGHLFGDEVLLLTSRLMKLTLRGRDQLFRFGGEEFLIVLEHTSDSGAHVAFDRLRSAIEAYTFAQVGPVTVSVGYTRVNPMDLPTTCVERADNALYYVLAISFKVAASVNLSGGQLRIDESNQLVLTADSEPRVGAFAIGQDGVEAYAERECNGLGTHAHRDRRAHLGFPWRDALE